MPGLVDLSRKLASGRLRAGALLQAAAEAPGLIARREAAEAEADLAERAAAAGLVMPRLSGVPLAVGSGFTLATGPVGPARDESPPVARLRRAGAVIIGKTWAGSGGWSLLGDASGLANPADSACLPGGSAAGAAVAVGSGAVPAAVCADALGGVRVPAAFCGLVGWRATPGRLGMAGLGPAGSDSLGVIAGSVSCCAVLDDILSDGNGLDVDSRPEGGVRLGVLEGLSDPAPEVSAALQGALTRLSSRGVRLSPLTLPGLAELEEDGPLFAAGILAADGDLPEALAAGWSAVTWLRRAARREDLRAKVLDKARGYDAILMPTAPVTAPARQGLTAPALAAIEARMCRNAWAPAWLGLPAISLPCQPAGALPVGLTLMAPPGSDRGLLAIARGLEAIIRGQGFAPTAGAPVR